MTLSTTNSNKEHYDVRQLNQVDVSKEVEQCQGDVQQGVDDVEQDLQGDVRKEVEHGQCVVQQEEG